MLSFGSYYHIELSRPASEQSNSPDTYQEKMSELMNDLEYVRMYIDNVIAITTTGDWDDHFVKPEEILKWLKGASLKVNAKKLLFGRHELEYLGY